MTVIKAFIAEPQLNAEICALRATRARIIGVECLKCVHRMFVTGAV
jgi:hypothetical protein